MAVPGSIAAMTRLRSYLVATILGTGALALGACATAPDRSTPSAAGPAIYSVTTAGPLESTQEQLEQALGQQGFKVLFRANIGASLAKFADKWGDDYNRSGLDQIHSVMFCNPTFANKTANADPMALALCPLRVTLIEKGGKTTILFARPSLAAAQTGAAAPVAIVEDMVIAAIDQAAK